VFFRLSGDAARNITGIAFNGSTVSIRLVNVGAFNIVLQNNNAGSATSNRILTGTGADLTLAAGSAPVLLQYDTVSRIWRVL
jgi:hypothetical protein